jgi:putative nucleotidyltransferase with HDIG domain
MGTPVVSSELHGATPPPGPALEAGAQAIVVTPPARLCELPPFNSIANRVLAMTADPDIDLREISKMIEGDPAFAADVLFLANSSLFGFMSRMQFLRHAIALLGLERTKALSVTVALRGLVGKKNALVQQCWQHSAACALVCEEIASIFEVSADRAYTAGIMHDIGRLGLLKSYPKEMTSVLTCQYSDMRDVLQAEMKVLMIDHTRAGSFLVNTWNLPKTFSEICEHHHDPLGANDSELLQLVKIACKISDAIGFAAVPCEQPTSYVEIAESLKPRLHRKALPGEDHLRSQVSERLAAFES